MKWKTTLMILALALAGLAVQGCSNSQSGPLSSDPPLMVKIQDILDKTDDYEGRQVILNCTFQGWRGKCRTGPPISRSDWMVEDDTGCIYATGALPRGLSAASPMGEKLQLTGTVKEKDGIPYLEARQAKRL